MEVTRAEILEELRQGDSLRTMVEAKEAVIKRKIRQESERILEVGRTQGKEAGQQEFLRTVSRLLG